MLGFAIFIFNTSFAQVHPTVTKTASSHVVTIPVRDMPLDCDGSQFAPSETPGQFMTINDDAWGGSDELWIFELNVDWNNTSNSTFARTGSIL